MRHPERPNTRIRSSTSSRNRRKEEPQHRLASRKIQVSPPVSSPIARKPRPVVQRDLTGVVLTLIAMAQTDDRVRLAALLVLAAVALATVRVVAKR